MSRIYQKQNDYDAARRKLKVSSTFISELDEPDFVDTCAKRDCSRKKYDEME